MNGGFSPLNGYMKQKDYDSVVNTLRLSSDYNEAVFPMPIVLDLPSADVAEMELVEGSRVTLRDSYFNPLAILEIQDVWQPDRLHEAQNVYGTTDEAHPSVNYLMNLVRFLLRRDRTISVRWGHARSAEAPWTNHLVGSPCWLYILFYRGEIRTLAARLRVFSFPFETTLMNTAVRHANCDSLSHNGAGSVLWHSRPVTPCTARTLISQYALAKR